MRIHKFLSVYKTCWFIALIATPALSWALPEDNEQPIRIVADFAVRDDKLGLTIYSGNVKLDQGSMSISASSITIYSDGENVNTLVAKGMPAHFTQIQADGQAPVTASGKLIEYFKQEQRISIQHQAALEQNNATVKSDNIQYYINEQLVKANGGDGRQSGRVEVVIPPRHKGEAP